MFAGWHKITVEQLPGGEMHNARVLVDGEPAKCSGYIIRQGIDELPTVQLRLLGYGRFEGEKARLEFDPNEVLELCKHMTKENLLELIKLWNYYHDAYLELAGLIRAADAITSKSE